MEIIKGIYGGIMYNILVLIPMDEDKKKKLCDTVEDVIKNIGDLYNESK